MPKGSRLCQEVTVQTAQQSSGGETNSPLLLSTLSPDTCDNDWAWNWVGSIQRVHPGLFAFHFRRIRGYCENLCIQERAWQKENGKTVGPTVLFFGCRNKDQDYIYRLVEATYCRESSYFFRLLLLLSCQGGAGGLGAGWLAHTPHCFQ